MRFIVLITIIVTVALIGGGSSMIGEPSSPCQDKSPKSHYKEFLSRHILQEEFDRNSLDAWKRYLKKEHLWCRTTVQSFLNKSDLENVIRICSRDGRRLSKTDNYAGNLCISNSEMLIYEVISTKSNNDCKITVGPTKRVVIVACNKVGNQCLPVHFQKYEHQRASNIPCSPARNFSIVVE
ncbi:unnamed protein product [Oreochromis niloticus]|nr:unnamed protein product [Mustela putorius furo]